MKDMSHEVNVRFLGLDKRFAANNPWDPASCWVKFIR